MRLATLFLVLMAGCGGGSSASSRLDGQWQYDQSNTSGLTLTFNADGSYLSQRIQITNVVNDSSGNPVSVMAQDEEERGTFVDNGTSVTFTPAEYSCPGADPASTLTYAFMGSNLVLSTPGAVVTFSRSPVSPPGVTYAIATGCFASDGSFTAQALMPVPAS